MRKRKGEMALETMLGGAALLTVLIAAIRTGSAMIAPILAVARAHEPHPNHPFRTTARRLDHA